MIGRNKWLVLLAGVALSACALAGCRHTPDETQVRDAIASVAEAAEAGSARDTVAPLDDDFDGNAGELDRQRLAAMIRMLSLRHEHIGVTTGPISIEHRGERIVATVTVTLSSGGKLLPDRLGVYKVVSAWRKDGDEWRCYSATWTQSI